MWRGTTSLKVGEAVARIFALKFWPPSPFSFFLSFLFFISFPFFPLPLFPFLGQLLLGWRHNYHSSWFQHTSAVKLKPFRGRCAATFVRRHKTSEPSCISDAGT